MTFDTSGFTPAQLRAWHGLLAGAEGRPPAQEEGPRWMAWLTERTAAAAARIPPGERGVFLNKHRLDLLSCDGRFLDDLVSVFDWSIAKVVGSLSHAGIEIDLAGQRARPVQEVLHQAWTRFVETERSGEFLSTLGGAEVDDLKAQAFRRILEFREVFPPLPADLMRCEVTLAVRLHGGQVFLNGRPDFLIGRGYAKPGERRTVLVDLKTGARHRHHRQDMRFYALLATIKYGVAPFRVATYYLDEADWEHEDVDDDVLEAAARDVAAKTERAVTLLYHTPPDSELRLVAGPACNWCGRNPTCPAAAEAERARLDAAP